MSDLVIGQVVRVADEPEWPGEAGKLARITNLFGFEMRQARISLLSNPHHCVSFNVHWLRPLSPLEQLAQCAEGEQDEQV